MKLVELKRTPVEVKEEQAEMTSPEVSLYPWGMCLYLDNEQMKKLNFPADAQIDHEFKLAIMVKVKRISATEITSGIDRSVELQITAMSAFVPEAEPKSLGETLYGKAK
jgi:hypothetical protein